MSLSHAADFIDTYYSDEEEVSPKEFLKRRKENPASVRDARFNPPRIGDSDFGRFIVKRQQGIFEVKRERKLAR